MASESWPHGKRAARAPDAAHTQLPTPNRIPTDPLPSLMMPQLPDAPSRIPTDMIMSQLQFDQEELELLTQAAPDGVDAFAPPAATNSVAPTDATAGIRRRPTNTDAYAAATYAHVRMARQRRQRTRQLSQQWPQRHRLRRLRCRNAGTRRGSNDQPMPMTSP